MDITIENNDTRREKCAEIFRADGRFAIISRYTWVIVV